MIKFRSLPIVGRIIIIAIAFGVFAIAAAACATSYNAIYHLVDMLGLYGTGITKTFPGLVDIAFIIAEMAAILGGIMAAVTRSEEVTKGWPYTTMWLCGLCTIAFNVWHAYLIGGRHDPLTLPRCIVASLPPILMMVSFQVLIAIVRWVMLHLGRPLNSASALSPTASAYGMPAEVGPSYSAGVIPQTGRTDLMLGSSIPKIDFARQLCRQKSATALAKTDGPALVNELATMGVGITPSEAWRAISEVKAEGNGSRKG
jgi:hypothetical protein